MRDYPIWSQVQKELHDGNDVVLLVVVGHRGSTPGKQGFKMLITSEGDQLGTIGGGIMELNMIDQANQLLKTGTPETSFVTQAHHKKAPKEQQSGLICAGTQYIVIQLLNDQYLDEIEYIIDSYNTDKDGIFQLGTAGIEINRYTQLPEPYTFDRTEEQWIYQENIGHPNTLYIFGGGHVGRAITQAVSMLDFYVVLNDNRPDLEMVTDNPYPHEIRTGDYSHLASQVTEGDNIFVVIVTYGFDYDAEVLEQVISKDVGYIGLMGSKAKLRRIFDLMRDKDKTEAQIKRVNAPVGLDIANETAEEIAISVAAQLIDIKNSK